MFARPLSTLNIGQQTDMKRLLMGGGLRSARRYSPASTSFSRVYDTLAKDKHRMATQWLDFEIVGKTVNGKS